MKLSELDKTKYQFTNDPVNPGGMKSAIPFTTGLSRMAATLGAEIGKAGMGLGEGLLKAGKVVSEFGESKGVFSKGMSKTFDKPIEEVKSLKENVFGKPFEKERQTTSGKVGQALGIAAPFVAGTPAITRGQGILANILQPISKIKGLGTLTKAASQAIPEAIGTGLTQLGISGGDTESAKEAATFAGGTSGVLSGLGSLGKATFFPELKNSVTRALGLSGKTSGGMVEPIIEKKIAGLSVVNKYAPDVKVKSADGFEKTFKPSESTFDETLQAWNSIRKTIFKKYHEISSKLGEAGKAEIDLQSVADDLNNIINSPRTSPYKDAARSVLKDLVDNFGQVSKGAVTFRKVKPDIIESFLSDLYVPASSVFLGKGEKAYGEIAAGAARGIRNLLDDAIESAGGAEYSGLRSEYSALKSIEDDLVRRFQQEARELGGGLSDYANIFSSGDLIAGFLSANPGLIAKGASQNFLFSLFRMLKRPNRYLQRSFELLNKADSSDLTNRMFGGIGGKALSESDAKFAQTIKDFVKKPKLGMSIEDVSKGAYKGETDLTTKILKDLEGKTTVSKQYILDATNRGELKQVERDLIRNILADEPATVNVSDFAKKVKAELLPLKRESSMADPGTKYSYGYGGNLVKYEGISLPNEIRGAVKNYSENIYESPIKTSAGQTHFSGQTDNYFGHTRIEDMADNKTRRVIEVQSDLYQKGNLDYELEKQMKGISNLSKEVPEGKMLSPYQEAVMKMKGETAQNGISKLQQYNDPTAHFRMVREEIKKASQDGKTKLQFPTGETAMKIEGLGDDSVNHWQEIYHDGEYNITNGSRRLKPENLEVGQMITQREGEDADWIITDVLGDGKFKAVPKSQYEILKNPPPSAYDTIPGHRESQLKINEKELERIAETFDISGKVDTNNPIYKFYEKDVQKYLNKFGGKRVVDDKGVSWFEIPIKKEWAKMPVEAFALIGGIGLGTSQMKE